MPTRCLLMRSVWLLLTIVFANVLTTAAVTANAADWERVQTPDNQALSLQGIALNRTLNENFYLTALYLAKPGADNLYDTTQARRLHFRILADRVYAAGINRHFRDLILINNARDELAREANTIQRFSSLFKLGLMRGDEMIIDYRVGKSTVINVNAVKVAEFSPRLFDFILRGLIGETPPSQLFKTQLNGSNNAERALLIGQFDATQANEERLKAYAGVEPTAAPAQVAPAIVAAEKTAPAPEKNPPEKTKTTPSVVNKPSATDSKPAIVAAKPAPVIESSNIIEKPASEKPIEKPVSVASREVAKPKAPPAPTPAQIENWLAEYQAMVSDKFHTAVSYPKREMKRKYGISQMARVKAAVVLRLFLDKGGDVNAAWLQKRSGETIVDQAALALVDVIAPFPPMRDELPDSAYEFYVELNYDPDL